MEPINLFVVEEDGETYAYSLELLEAQHPEYFQDRNIHNKEDLEQIKADMVAHYGHGAWHEMRLVHPFLGKHHQDARRKCYEPNPINGQPWYNQDRFAGALVETVVASWTLPYIKTESGYDSMPFRLQQLVGALITVSCYGDGKQAEGFTKPYGTR